jgi:hypothetical protein
MSPAEIKARLATLCASVGPNASASVHIGISFGGDVYAALRPDGYGSETNLTAYGSSFDEALSGIERAWLEHAVSHRSATVRKMALTVIELTSDHGCCTDAALRAEFGAHDVKALGAAAVAEATRLSEGGPFRILETEGSNHADD